MSPEQKAGKAPASQRPGTQRANPAAALDAVHAATARAGFEATDFGDDTGKDEEPAFKPLTREEAQALRAGRPLLSPWRVVVVQAIAGVCATLVWWLVSGRVAAAWSALYGAAATVVPGALMARGMSRGLSGASPGTAVLGFMLWEFVKIFVAVVMLVAAPRVVPDLSWPALLVSMIVCMKASWLALLWQRRMKKTS